MATDRGRKYKTIDKSLKTKTQINNEYYFKYIRGRMMDKVEPVYHEMDEELFWKLTPDEVKIYFFGT